MRGLATTVIIALAATTASAQSPPQPRASSVLLAEVNAWEARYHENPAHIDLMRIELSEAAKADPQADTLIALAKVCFIAGDVRAKNPEERLEAYSQGLAAAKRAVELAPHSVAAHSGTGRTRRAGARPRA